MSHCKIHTAHVLPQALAGPGRISYRSTVRTNAQCLNAHIDYPQTKSKRTKLLYGISWNQSSRRDRLSDARRLGTRRGFVNSKRLRGPPLYCHGPPLGLQGPKARVRAMAVPVSISPLSLRTHDSSQQLMLMVETAQGRPVYGGGGAVGEHGSRWAGLRRSPPPRYQESG